MRSLKFLFSLSLLATLLASCGALPQNVTINIVEPTQDVNQVVQSTFQAMTAQAVTSQPLATPVPSSTKPAPSAVATTGSISGQLNYPAQAIPAMYVAAYLVGAQNYQYVITNPGQGNYQIDNLPPGKYHVIAYTVGGGGFPAGLAGGYTKAVQCGLGAACTDHTLIDVTVESGKDASGINPLDWYAPQGTFQPFPQQAQSQPTTSTTPVPSFPQMGTISGALTYPASVLPSLRIAAFELTTNQVSYMDTTPGQSTYTLDLPVGKYHVVAYPIDVGSPGLAGGYSKAVPCGLSASCTDHTLIDVTVTAGNMTPNVNPDDWYAPSGTFPPKPGP